MAREFYEIFAATLTPYRCALFAKRFGLHQDTIRAWARPVESDQNPTGTGKNSILNHADFVIAETQKTHPAEAQEMIDALQMNYDRRDYVSGARIANTENSFKRPLVRSIRENADVVAVLASDASDSESLTQARVEIREAISAYQQLDSCLEQLLNNQKDSCGWLKAVG